MEKYLSKKQRFVRKERNARILKTIGFGPMRTQPDYVRKMILRAREEIGYSPKTVDCDILSALWRQYRSVR